MAENTSVKKTSKRASINFPVGSEDEVTYKYTYKKSKKRKAKKAKKAVKKVGVKGLLIALLVLAIGVGAGIGAFYLFCKNDEFVILGTEELTITLDEKYTDEGVKIVAFGKDIKDKVIITTNLKVDENGDFYAEEVGTYYIKYTTNELKYGSIFKIQKIRLVTVVEPSETEETNSANASESIEGAKDNTEGTGESLESSENNEGNADEDAENEMDVEDGEIQELAFFGESDNNAEFLIANENTKFITLSSNVDCIQNFEEESRVESVDFLACNKYVNIQVARNKCGNTEKFTTNGTSVSTMGGIF